MAHQMLRSMAHFDSLHLVDLGFSMTITHAVGGTGPEILLLEDLMYICL